MEIKINKINDSIHYYKLENGLDIYFYTKSNICNNYVTFTTKYGSMYNKIIDKKNNKVTILPNGIAHFLEHMVFNQEDGISPFTLFEKNGASCNANTSIRRTTYLFKGPDNLEENINILLDFVQSPYFTEESVLKEQGIISEEINMYKDQPVSVLYEKMKYNSLNTNPIRESVIGEIADIKKIDKDLLYKCYNTFYHPSNMFLVVCGNFDMNKILDVIKNNQSKKKFAKTHEIVLEKIIEKDKVYKDFEIIKMNTLIPKFAYTLKIPTKIYDIKDLSLYLYILFSILFDSTSDFNILVKEKNIITNTLSINIFNCDTHILVYLYSQTKKYLELLKYIENTLKKINIKQSDFDRKKKVLISNEILAYDSIFSVNDLIIDDILFDNKIDNDIINRIENLNLDTLNEIIKKINFNNKNVILVCKDEDNVL